jgi:hypothetical protein
MFCYSGYNYFVRYRLTTALPLAISRSKDFAVTPTKEMRVPLQGGVKAETPMDWFPG